MLGSFILLLSVCFILFLIFCCKKKSGEHFSAFKKNMGRQKKTNGYANPTKKTSSLILVKKGGGHRFEKKTYWHSLFFWWIYGLGCSACFFCSCLSVLFCFYFFAARKNQEKSFLRSEKKHGKTEEWTREPNLTEEHDRRASIVLPINPLKINTSQFDSLATRRG